MFEERLLISGFNAVLPTLFQFENTNATTCGLLKRMHRTCLYEEFEDTKGVIRIHISKKKRQHNGKKQKYKRTNNDLQRIHIKLKIELHESH